MQFTMHCFAFYLNLYVWMGEVLFYCSFSQSGKKIGDGQDKNLSAAFNYYRILTIIIVVVILPLHTLEKYVWSDQNKMIHNLAVVGLEKLDIMLNGWWKTMNHEVEQSPFIITILSNNYLYQWSVRLVISVLKNQNFATVMIKNNNQQWNCSEIKGKARQIQVKKNDAQSKPKNLNIPLFRRCFENIFSGQICTTVGILNHGGILQYQQIFRRFEALWMYIKGKMMKKYFYKLDEDEGVSFEMHYLNKKRFVFMRITHGSRIVSRKMVN